jgi:hypothetical protein
MKRHLIIAEAALAGMLELSPTELRELAARERLPFSFTAGAIGFHINDSDLGSWQSAAKRKPS